MSFVRRRLCGSRSGPLSLSLTQGRGLRTIALGVVAAGVVLPLVRRRLRLPPVVTGAAVASAPVALAIATRRSVKRDVAIYSLQMWAFMVIHELPNDDHEKLIGRTRVDYPIAFDQKLFKGRSVNGVLQQKIARADTTTALDLSLTWVHWLWFLQPHATSAYIRWRHPERFGHSATLVCAVFDIGMLCYFLVPTAPPWWAAERGKLGSVRRIMTEVGERFWGRHWESMYSFLGGNPVAAMPSLHFATSVMAAHVLSDVDPKVGALAWAYAGTLGFALVYLGEHYVVDLAAGLLLTEAVRVAGPRLESQVANVSKVVQALESRALA